MPGVITVHNDVTVRDQFGRFAAHCAEAARKTADEAAERGAAVARAAAPRKTGAMAGTIHAVGGDGSMAQFVVGTGHWAYQEFGTAPHDITGEVSFEWEREGRRWVPGTNTIHHPGNHAVPFMLTGYEAAKVELVAAMQRNYRI